MENHWRRKSFRVWGDQVVCAICEKFMRGNFHTATRGKLEEENFLLNINFV